MMKGKTQMSRLKDKIYVSNEVRDDGDIIAVNEETLEDNFPCDAIAGSPDDFYTMNLKKGNYILFKAIDAITIDDDEIKKFNPNKTVTSQLSDKAIHKILETLSSELNGIENLELYIGLEK